MVVSVLQYPEPSNSNPAVEISNAPIFLVKDTVQKVSNELTNKQTEHVLEFFQMSSSGSHLKLTLIWV